MRKIEYCESGYYGGVGNDEPKGIKIGFFHVFSPEGSLEYGIDPVAVIEKLDGYVMSVAVSRIRFLEPPEDQP